MLSESYTAALAQRVGVKSELGYRCLCCRDTAIIPAYLLQKYEINHLDPALKDLILLPSAEGFLCRNPICKANEITVEKDGNPVHTFVYRPSALNQSLSPDLCAYVHEQEIKALRSQQKSADIPARSFPITAEIVNAIAKPFPKEAAHG